MKKVILILILATVTTFTINAQKIAFVDTEYILNNIPAYENALKQIDKLAEKWQKDISSEYQVIDQMYRDYQNQSVMFTDNMKQRKEEEIINKEKAVKALQKSKFGQEGELFQKRQELIEPIQQKIYNAINRLAKNKDLDFIFDKSSGGNMLFANPRYDRSDDVLESLGY